MSVDCFKVSVVGFREVSVLEGVRGKENNREMAGTKLDVRLREMSVKRELTVVVITQIYDNFSQ